MISLPVCVGRVGGYLLNRPTEEIFVAQIVDAVNEAVDATGCGGEADCQGGEICLTHYLWCDLSDQIHSFLSGISLASLVARNDVQNVAARQNLKEQRVELPDQQIGQQESTIPLSTVG